MVLKWAKPNFSRSDQFIEIKKISNSLLLLTPAVLVLLFCLVVALTTTEGIQSIPRSSWSFLAASVIWVPIVEEIVFRRGFGRFFRGLSGPIWGAYFSAVFFAVVHTHPSLQAVLAGEIGVPVGPLLLGLSVEALYTFSGQKLWPSILLHAACNLSVVIFTVIDPKWLDWLKLLYS